MCEEEEQGEGVEGQGVVNIFDGFFVLCFSRVWGMEVWLEIGRRGQKLRVQLCKSLFNGMRCVIACCQRVVDDATHGPLNHVDRV